MGKIPADYGRSEEDPDCLDRGCMEIVMMLRKKLVVEKITFCLAFSELKTW